MNELVTILNDMIWGSILIYLLLGAGIWFTVRTRFVQFRRFGFSFKTMMGSRNTSDANQISSFQAFCTSLAARVGTGNLAGVAAALYLGGPGAVFWMWLIALLGMSTSLVENTLAQAYKTNNGDGTFRGGPAYYIQKALNQRWLAVLFSISLIIAFGFAFNSVQSNSIAAAVSGYGVPPLAIGIGLAVLAGLVIFGGIRTISKVAEAVVPFMAVAYLAVALVVVVMNFAELPEVFALIFRSAFGLQEAAGGAIGVAMMQGIRRGLFSNEAGMGSGPNAAATATPHPHHPAAQGMLGMAGVFVDTMVICTATAAIILFSGMLEAGSGVTGIQLTQAALSAEVGSWGNHLIALAILLFAFTSLIANYYYGESNLRFIIDNKLVLLAYRVLVLTMVIWGAVGELQLVWNFADLAMGVMALINIGVILVLGKQAFAMLRDLDEQIDSGKPMESISFNRNKFEFLNKTMDQDVWTDGKAAVSTRRDNAVSGSMETA
ncbi:alanine/glycine:cation symporter family protein [Spongorhabdus nitratireducens]